MLSPRQNARYRPLVSKAWGMYCLRNQINLNVRAAFDAWYRKVLVSNLGIYSTKEISERDEAKFDALCLCFATAAGDQAAIEYWSTAAERRALWRLEQTMKKAGVDWPYINGIARNMGFGERPVQDLPAELILKLNTAVFVYLKRKEKRHAVSA